MLKELLPFGQARKRRHILRKLTCLIRLFGARRPKTRFQAAPTSQLPLPIRSNVLNLLILIYRGKSPYAAPFFNLKEVSPYLRSYYKEFSCNLAKAIVHSICRSRVLSIHYHLRWLSFRSHVALGSAYAQPTRKRRGSWQGIWFQLLIIAIIGFSRTVALFCHISGILSSFKYSTVAFRVYAMSALVPSAAHSFRVHLLQNQSSTQHWPARYWNRDGANSSANLT